MALIRNHGYGATRLDMGPNQNPIIRVTDHDGAPVTTVSVSSDGLNWEIGDNEQRLTVLPLTSSCADVADIIVDVYCGRSMPD